MAARQFSGPLDDGERGWNIAVCEEFLQGPWLYRTWDAGMLQERGELTSERAKSGPRGVPTRVLPEPVARQEQSPPAPVENRECKHTIEVHRQIGAPFLPAVYQNFGVRTARREAMAPPLELSS